MKARLNPGDQARRASTLLEVLATVVVIGLLAGLLLPAVGHRRTPAKRISCVNNLKNIGLAFRIFASDNEERLPWAVSSTNGGVSLVFGQAGAEAWTAFTVISNELSVPKLLVCPADGQRRRATNFAEVVTAPRTSGGGNQYVSYFVGLNASGFQQVSILGGDRNLMTNGVAVSPGWLALGMNQAAGWTKAIHQDQGNVLMADGSVQQVTSGRLRTVVADAEKALGGPAHLLVP